MKITDGGKQIRDTRILYKGKWGVIIRARVGRTPKPLIADIRLQFGDRVQADISNAVWDEKKNAWVCP